MKTHRNGKNDAIQSAEENLKAAISLLIDFRTYATQLRKGAFICSHEYGTTDVAAIDRPAPSGRDASAGFSKRSESSFH